MGALYEPDHLGKSLRITVKLRTGVADTADTLSTKETAFICRSLLIYASKFRKVISARPVSASTSCLPRATKSNAGAL